MEYDPSLFDWSWLGEWILRRPHYYSRHQQHHYDRVRLKIVVTDGGGRHKKTDAYILQPNKELHIMSAVTVGHIITYTWSFVDANGNAPPEGSILPVADAATWSNTPATPPVDTFTPSGGPVEMSAVLAATAAGSDTVNLVVLFTPAGGTQQTFSASDAVTISAAPFVPAGVRILTSIQ